ncbi:hypothetical protein M9Y10_031586 [Tritrichomonas musculus]|uniref:Uncharacterized protein n=1 Tax=Tritrichomonas musculus TaxID=1915356 RepID=A0ABR2H101_9EUKA
MQNIPKECCHPGFKHEVITIRWTSLFDCSEYILENINSLQNSGSQIVLNSIGKIESKIGFVNLVQMLKLMVIFVKEVEKDLSSISDIIPIYLKTIYFLLFRDTHDDSIAGGENVSRSYLRRLINTNKYITLLLRNSLHYAFFGSQMDLQSNSYNDSYNYSYSDSYGQ